MDIPTINLAEKASKSGVKKIYVYMSVLVKAEEDSVYVEFKKLAEDGLTWHWLIKQICAYIHCQAIISLFEESNRKYEKTLLSD